MKDILIKDQFNIELEPKTVLCQIQCYENNPVYQDVLQEFEQLKPLVLNRIQPKAAICFAAASKEYTGVISLNSPVLYSIATLGRDIVKLSEEYFARDEYLKAVLVDAMADACLFGMEMDLLNWIKDECIKRGFGVSHRYEPPVNIPVDVIKEAYEALNAAKTLRVSITSGYMFDPVKTNCQIFALTKNCKEFHIDHDCGLCNFVNCTVRAAQNILVKAVTKEGEKVFLCNRGETLLDAMSRNGIYVNGVCGGNGTCGKCKIKLLDGELKVTSFDKDYFSETELQSGWRLACKAIPKTFLKICIEETENFYVLSDFKEKSASNGKAEHEEYSIAADIGTTTLAIALIEKKSKRILDTYTTINHQRSFGADVISRIQASLNGKGNELKKIIQNDLLTGIKELLGRNGLNKKDISEIAIAANTTMGHLFLGYDIRGLSLYPFHPVDISLLKLPFDKVFQDSEDMGCQVILLPGISAYVGADIVSGLYFCGFHESEHINLLVDLGTNGEIGIGNRNQILTTSTAAGPAFEGGNITWGTGSIEGAICNVSIRDSQVKVTTIGDKPPAGICGTGLIEATAELLKAKIMDETGLLINDYFDKGFPLAVTKEGKKIILTQKDIRELQLAKSAIRSGIETLLYRYAINYEQIDKVFLAGGFGHKLNLDKAVLIGLLPEELAGHVEVVGNSSLGGAIKYLTESNPDNILGQIVASASEINLANDTVFRDLYIKNMNFDENN